VINSISSQHYAVQQVRNNTNKVEQISADNTQETKAIVHYDTRKYAVSFIENASPEELTAKVDSLIGRMPSMAAINLNEIMNADNGFEIAERINRLQEPLKQAHQNVLNLEQDLISQGRAKGKSDKEILMSIVQMQDEQSDLFKMSMNWGTKGLTSPDNYAKLVEYTPNYVNYYT